MPIERRFLKGLRLEQRDGVKMPTLRGHAAVFDSEGDGGWFTEVVRPGAFTRTLREGPDTAALVNHDSNLILGRKSASTLRMSEDTRGLAVEIDLPETTAGRDVAASVERGDLTGMSFSFTTMADQWSTKDGKDFRELLDVDLFDVAVVAFPFYSETDIGIRSAGDDAEARRSRDSVLAAAMGMKAKAQKILAECQ